MSLFSRESFHQNIHVGQAQNRPTVVFSSRPQKLVEYLKEVLKYRFLIGVFAFQELKVTYAQTYFGLLWSVVRPLLTLFIFTLIFRNFLHVHTEKPYYIFAFSGLLGWNFFSQIVQNGSVAIIQKQNLVHKMYFPRLILILAKIVVSGIEFAISLLIFFFLMLFAGIKIEFSILTLPFFILINIVCAFSLAIWMNALNTRFRDLNQLIPSIIGIAIWITPVFYPASVIPHDYEFFVYANPMAGVIKGYRFALLGESFPEYQYWISIGITVLISISGLFYFNKIEDRIINYA